MSLINTYHISTLGINSKVPYTIVSNGILIRIEITPYGPVSGDNYFGNKKKEEETKKITITAYIDGKEYIETIIVQGKPNLSVKDFEVEISYDNLKPKITVNFK